MGSTAIPAPPRKAGLGSKRLLALRGDEQLVARVRAGDPAAFEALYERHVGGILSFCRHMLGSRDEAEDAVQMVFVSAHNGLLRDERDIKLKPWLYAIARNRCLSMLRARREEQEEVEVSTAGLHDEVQQRADLREMLADLHDLPEDQRAALVLSELRDLSHAEVGEVLGCEAAQVKGLVFRARSGLVERREARDADCEEIRAELATARGGTLRRGRLRHHLKACPGCAAYREDIRTQKRMMAMLLPVVPTAGLKSTVLAAVGLGGGGAGGAAAGGGAVAGGAALAGGGASAAAPVAAGMLVKIAVAGALAGGAGVAATQVVDRGDSTRAPAAEAERDARAGDAGPRGAEDGDTLSRSRAGGPAGAREGRDTPRERARARERREARRVASRAEGRGNAVSRGVVPPGLAKKDADRGRPASPGKSGEARKPKAVRRPAPPNRPTTPRGRARKPPATPGPPPPKVKPQPAPQPKPKAKTKPEAAPEG